MSIFALIAMAMAVHSCYIGSKVLVSLFALSLGASQLSVGLLAACYAVFPLLLGVYTGRLTDRRGVRMPLMVGSALTCVAMLMGFVWRDVAGLFAVAALMGASFVFFNVSVQTLAGAIGKPEHRTRNFAWLSIGYSSSNLIGPVLVGLLIDHGGHSITFLVLAAFPLLPLALLASKPGIARLAPRSKPGDERASTFDLLGDRLLRKLIIISGLSVASAELFAFYVPVYAHEIGLSATVIGVILGSYALAIVLMRFMLGRIMQHLTSEQIMVWFLLVAAAAFAIFPLFSNAYALMATAFVIGLGVGATQPILMSVSYERAPSGRAGEMTGLRLTVNNVARISMPVLCGAVGAALGASPVFWMNAANLVATSYLSRR
jgi:MFS family permease